MEQRRRSSGDQKQSGGIAGQILGLSLFIMLLAFFIVLNSISTFDDARVEPMAGSLEQAFSYRNIIIETPIPPLSHSDAMGVDEGKTLDRIGGIFEAELKNIETITTPQQGVMHMRMKRAEFERVINRIAAGEKPSFLSTLASVLRSADRQDVYGMEITYNLPDNPARFANRKPQELETAIQSVAAIAQKIEQAGLPARQISIALQKGRPDFVELTFRRLDDGGKDGE